uniref:Uncharacterized protein n=1 Tax=Picea glauca TaxID=3330 RepID=A0A101LYH2_PICGL|nr:hypothetical protein ABT39_MTgene5891 [Picea glauca]
MRKNSRRVVLLWLFWLRNGRLARARQRMNELSRSYLPPYRSHGRRPGVRLYKSISLLRKLVNPGKCSFHNWKEKDQIDTLYVRPVNRIDWTNQAKQIPRVKHS